MSHDVFSYAGSELELFSGAVNWKKYLRQHISRFLGSRVLEVGAGLGGTTVSLYNSSVDQWLALEPDPSLLQILEEKIEFGELPPNCQSYLGTIADLPSSLEGLFDSILYVDVLEHINDDFSEVKKASQYLATGGFLIVLSPAHQWLYTPFDEAIGHYRRYNRDSLLRLTPSNLHCVSMKYLDSVGLLASLANRLVLKSSQPSKKQITFWDQYMVNCLDLPIPCCPIP